MTQVHRLFQAAVLLVVVGADALVAQAPAAGQLRAAWTSPCTLDVVLVTFRDTTARHPRETLRRTYHDHDRPYGYFGPTSWTGTPGA